MPPPNWRPAIPFTRLDVDGGQVRFTRLTDQENVNVAAGEFAVAGENRTLKAYPSDTEWIEGRMIFEDDFSDGLRHWILGQTRVHRETLTGSDEPFVAEDTRFIGPDTFDRDGHRLPGIRMVAGKDSDIMPFMMLNRPVEESAYVVEWEFAFISSSSAGPFFFQQTEEDDILFLGKQAYDIKTDFRKAKFWMTLRIELTPLAPSHYPYAIRRKVYYNGKLGQDARTAFQMERLGFNLQKGEIFMNHCTVRELLPVSDVLAKRPPSAAREP